MFRPKNHLQTENKIIRNTHCNVMIAGDDFVFSLKMACKAAACRCWLITSRTVFRLDLYLFFKALYIYIYIYLFVYSGGTWGPLPLQNITKLAKYNVKLDTNTAVY